MALTTIAVASWALAPSGVQFFYRSPAMATMSHAPPFVCRAVMNNSSSHHTHTRLARDDLLGLIQTEERGLKTQHQPSKRAQIVKAVEALAVLGCEQTTTDERLSGTWRMLWTTEKEQLFIVEKAPLLGTQAGDILQVSPFFFFIERLWHPLSPFVVTVPRHYSPLVRF